MVQALHGKEGKKYGSRKERDDALNAEVSQLQETLSKQQDNKQALQDEVAQLSSACMEKSQEIGNQQAAIQKRQDSLARCERLAASAWCGISVAVAHAVHFVRKASSEFKAKACSCSQPIRGAAGRAMNCGSGGIPL